jgi:pimeloyl-ACP methyl ester carboxylesterase
MKGNAQNTAGDALAIHGAGGGGWEWAVWQRVWRAGGLNLSAPDLQPAAAGLAATTLADYVAQMRAAAASQTVLIGASLGGLIALLLAAPLAPRALVLVNPLPPAGLGPRPPPRRRSGPVVAWGSQRSLAGTRRALPDADDAAVLYALRRWRDESGAALDEAIAGVELAQWPRCPVLVIASEADTDVPWQASQAVAAACRADFWLCPGASHAGPLLGRAAAALAARALAWTQAVSAFASPSQVPPPAE